MRSVPILKPAVAILFVAMMVLAACGGNSSNDSKDTMTVVPEPRGNFQANFNPLLVGAANDCAFGMIYEPLMAQHRYNGTPPQAWLATSADWNSDHTQITFHLRTDVKWSDGQAFTSDDVVYTFNLLKQYSSLDTNGFWAKNPASGLVLFNSVTNPDPSTVVIKFNENASVYEWYFAAQTPIVAQHTYSKMSDPSKDLNSKPIGTGPYTLSKFAPSLITLTANSHYWQTGLPKIKTLKYPAFDSNTSAELVLNNNEIDWAGVAYANVVKWSSQNSDNHYFYAPTNVTALYLNLTKPPFNDLAFRKAVSAAINRDNIVKQGSWGLGIPASPTGILVPNFKSYISSQYANLQYGSADAPSGNIAIAQQILNNAGYTKDGSGKYLDKSGKPISFAINVVSGWTDWDQIVALMVQDLNQLGLTVTDNEEQYAQYFTQIQTGQFDASISWTTQGPSPYYPLFAMLASSNTEPVGQQAASNWERFSNSTIDTALQQFATTADTTTQSSAIASIEQIMVTQLPVIVLYENFGAYDYRTTKFTGWPTSDNYYDAGMPYSHPEDARVVLHLQPK
jgi:peptide/nickel transport system substrate-binding protein